MTGNPRKASWNRPGSVGRHKGRSGSTLGDYRDAVDEEDAVMAAGFRKARARRENAEARHETREAKARAKVTLSSPEWLAKFMMDD